MSLNKSQRIVYDTAMASRDGRCSVHGRRWANAALALVSAGVAREVARDFYNNWFISICIISEVNNTHVLKRDRFGRFVANINKIV